MKILFRRVNTSKTPEEIMHILKNSAYPGRKAVFSEDSFSMHCMKRRAYQYKAAVPVKGYIIDPQNGAVRIEIHANLLCYLCILIGLVFLRFGADAIYWWICTGGPQWTKLGISLLGLLISAMPLWDGIETLDLLEHKLTRDTGGIEGGSKTLKK